jgi:SAM-dependent methyltransferase
VLGSSIRNLRHRSGTEDVDATGTLSWEEAVLRFRSLPENRDLVRDCYLDDPVESAAERFFRSSEWQAARSVLPARSGLALDVGSGRGLVAWALARDGWDVHAVEPDTSAVVGAFAIRQLARRTGTTLRIERAVGEALPYRDGTFDLVFGRQVLHHARDPYAFCREIARVLRSGGAFVFTREHVITFPGDLRRFRRRHDTHDLTGTEKAYRVGRYRSFLEKSGLEVTKVLRTVESEINLFPHTRESLRELLARKLHLPKGSRLPAWTLAVVDRIYLAPGRPYSFVGSKA